MMTQATVIKSCVDPGQQQRDLENMLRSITFSLKEVDCSM
jgi:hypothetical protein